MHGTGGLVEERAGPVDVVVLLVLPPPRDGIAPHGAGVAVRLHLEALHEDVLDDPEPFLFDDLDHLELVATPDIGEGQITRREMYRAGCRFDHHDGPSFRPRLPPKVLGPSGPGSGE